MRLLQLRYFLEVANSQNITRSAQKLHVSQPSLSRSIRELEMELGTDLFIRNGKSIRLSKMGKYFQNTVSKSLREIDNTIQVIQQSVKRQDNVFTLRFADSSPFIPKMIKYIRSRVTTVEIQLVQNGLEDLEPEHYDFEFSTYPIKKNKNIQLGREEIVLIVSKCSSLANKNQINVNELAGQDFIMTEKTPLRKVIEHFFEDNGLKIHPIFETGDHETLLELIKEDMGIGFIPLHSWPDLKVENLQLIHFTPEKLYRDIFLSYHPELHKNAKHTEVETVIKDFFKEMLNGKQK